MRSLLVPLALAALSQAAHAGEISSAYTDLDPDKDCVPGISEEGDWESLVCSGYRGYPVLIDLGDDRESVYYGFPTDDISVYESFSAFNSPGPKVEWRIETNNDVAVPFAVIHSRSVSSPDSDGKPIEVLVVAKVGLVLATDNPQANDQARKIADEKAKGFACGKDKREVFGNVPAFERQDTVMNP
ncbi:MAG: hypothetical protein E5V96_03010 [Mesorhizobium sp.]|nr:MAG: hypothetical protein E5V96_03010 [Mesorhizobium sp.]